MANSIKAAEYYGSYLTLALVFVVEVCAAARTGARSHSLALRLHSALHDNDDVISPQPTDVRTEAVPPHQPHRSEAAGFAPRSDSRRPGRLFRVDHNHILSHFESCMPQPNLTQQRSLASHAWLRALHLLDSSAV